MGMFDNKTERQKEIDSHKKQEVKNDWNRQQKEQNSARHLGNLAINQGNKK